MAMGVDLMSYLKEHDEHRGTNSYDYLQMRSFLGTLEIESCEKCGYLKVYCAHEFNTWTEDGKTLLCNLCGVDGT